MDFYALQFTLNKAIRGTNEYVEKHHVRIPHAGHYVDEPHFIGNIFNERTDFEPYLLDFELFPKSNVLDFFTDSGPAAQKLMVSGKLKRILEGYRKTGLQFFRTHVVHKDIVFDDFWILNFHETNNDLIDFPNSELYRTEHVIKRVERLKVASYAEYLTVKNHIDNQGYPHGLLIDGIKLQEDIALDFFCLTQVLGGTRYLVSEKLKKAIEEARCSGIEFMPAEMKLTEWLQGGEREKVYGKA